MTTQSTPNPDMEGLRERNVKALPNEAASAASAASGSGNSSGQDTPQTENGAEKEKKTFGRTPDGTGISHQSKPIPMP